MNDKQRELKDKEKMNIEKQVIPSEIPFWKMFCLVGVTVAEKKSLALRVSI